MEAFQKSLCVSRQERRGLPSEGCADSGGTLGGPRPLCIQRVNKPKTGFPLTETVPSKSEGRLDPVPQRTQSMMLEQETNDFYMRFLRAVCT